MTPHGKWRVFRKIWRRNSWGSAESASGQGSTTARTELLRRRLPAVLSELGMRSRVDAPCGDMNWMRLLDYRFERFIGVDILPELIDGLRAQDFPPTHHFQVANIATDILPRADAVFSRDFLVHLPFAEIEQVIARWRIAGFRYVFATTFVGWPENRDCRLGGWRPLDMQAPPFNGPPPLAVPEREPTPADPYRHKSMGAWE
jgi:hypothetical protein